MPDIIRKEIQPQQLYIAENVEAQTESKLRLPGGTKESRWYSLGSQSTVPFVQFIGGGAVQKIFTWGEMIEVPPNQEVLVRNASLMRGDIIIVSGKDPVARPRRITVPVTMLDATGGTGPWTDFSVENLITTEFPCDTRNCHEAYLDIRIQGGNQNGSLVIVQVEYWDFIHTYTAQLVALPGFTAPWGKNEVLVPDTNYTRIPLGISQHVGNWAAEPASLRDKVEVIIGNAIVADSVGYIDATGFWVLNY
jgi:hypothetical protein